MSKSLDHRVTQLYDGLTNKERAMLTLHYIGARDLNEIKRIQASVPRRTYTEPDDEFIRWRDGITIMMLLFDGMYWRAMGAFLAAKVVAGALGAEDARSDESRALAQLKAVWAALADVCEERGIPIADALVLTDAKDYDWSEETAPDPERRAEVKGHLLGCLPT